MLVVIALGGNALIRRGQPLEAEVQRANVKTAVKAVAAVAREHEVVVTHGNGPQVGLLAMQTEALRDVGAYPLDVLDAESEGMIGYLVEQELANELPDRDVATLLTQVLVEPDDPAFSAPTKPVGPVYPEARARELAATRGWTIAPDGDAWRRVVPSPIPHAIVELRTIELLVDAGVVVVCAGGGGIPVVLDERGGFRGVEAVVDKDRAAALLADQLGADALLMLTDVPAVFTGWGTPEAAPVRRAGPGDLGALELEPGSMGPKVEAACWFASSPGRFAAIGALQDAAALVRQEAGTVVTHDAGPITWHETG